MGWGRVKGKVGSGKRLGSLGLNWVGLRGILGVGPVLGREVGELGTFGPEGNLGLAWKRRGVG